MKTTKNEAMKTEALNIPIVSIRLSNIQRAKNIIERNNIMIEIYKNNDCVSDKVAEMRAENIQMQLLLNGYPNYENS